MTVTTWFIDGEMTHGEHGLVGVVEAYEIGNGIGAMGPDDTFTGTPDQCAAYLRYGGATELETDCADLRAAWDRYPVTLPDSCTCPRGPICPPCWSGMENDPAGDHDSCQDIIHAGCEADYDYAAPVFCSRYGCGEVVPDDQLEYDEQPYTDYDGTRQFAGDGLPYHAKCLALVYLAGAQRAAKIREDAAARESE